MHGRSHAVRTGCRPSAGRARDRPPARTPERAAGSDGGFIAHRRSNDCADRCSSWSPSSCLTAASAGAAASRPARERGDRCAARQHRPRRHGLARVRGQLAALNRAAESTPRTCCATTSSRTSRATGRRSTRAIRALRNARRAGRDAARWAETRRGARGRSCRCGSTRRGTGRSCCSRQTSAASASAAHRAARAATGMWSSRPTSPSRRRHTGQVGIGCRGAARSVPSARPHAGRRAGSAPPTWWPPRRRPTWPRTRTAPGSGTEVGFATWNAQWYGGHHMAGYSLLYPPLAALAGTRLVGVVAGVAAVRLFAGSRAGARRRRRRARSRPGSSPPAS